MLTSNDFPQNFYRVAVKALVVEEGKILLGRESPSLSGKWELPGGGQDFGEDYYDCLERELDEEYGARILSVDWRPTYSWPWLYQNERNMEWYSSMVLGYRVKLKDFNFSFSSLECVEARFFSKEELWDKSLLLGQAQALRYIFDPNDFR